jgi:ribose 5-phosphate isomerase B
MDKRLITETDVRAAAGDGKLQVARNTIVTPAARDLAQQLGVALVEGGRAAEREDRRAVRREGGGSTIAMGSDHGGLALKQVLKGFVTGLGFEVSDVGCHSTDSVDYPVFAAKVADMVSEGDAQFGIMVDGAGIGSSMVANKIPGVRAALCYDLTTAENAREHNNANVLTLGGSLIGERLAKEIVRKFLTTPFAGGRHQRRVAMIDALDRRSAVSGQRTADS